MICGNCGADNAPENEYCIKCGQELSAQLIVQGAVCAKHPNRFSTSTCSVCGIELCEGCEHFVHDAVYCEDCLKRPQEQETPSQPAQQIKAHPAAAQEQTQAVRAVKGRPARLIERGAAAFLDLAVLVCGAAVIAILFSTFWDESFLPMMTKHSLFKIYWLSVSIGSAMYCLGSIASTGQTPGMSALDLVIIGYDGRLPSRRQAFARFISSMLSVMLIFGLFMPLWDSKGRMWHDKIAHTVMIKVG